MRPTSTFIQRKTSKAVAVERITKKMEKQRKAQILDADVIQESWKSTRNCTASATSFSLSDKQDKMEVDKRHPEHRSRSRFRDRHHEKDEKRSST